MSKHNLMKKIASIATELDYAGFTKEAMNMDQVLLKVAQEEAPKDNLQDGDEPLVNRGFLGNAMSSLFGKLTDEQRESLERRKNKINEDLEALGSIIKEIFYMLELAKYSYDKSKIENALEQLALLKSYIAIVHLKLENLDLNNKKNAFVVISKCETITQLYITSLQKQGKNILNAYSEVSERLSSIKKEFVYMRNDFRK